jgi:transcriptional regulator with XRE-family HTH domain
MSPVRLNFRLPKPKQPIPVTVGDHVRARRLELGLTLAEAGEAIGVCWNAVMRWEGGSRVPDVKSVPAVIRFFGYEGWSRSQHVRTSRTYGVWERPCAAKR